MNLLHAVLATVAVASLGLAQQEPRAPIPAEEAARMFVQALANGTDDPDAVLGQVIAAAMATDTASGSLLLREAIARMDGVQEPAQSLSLLRLPWREPQPAIARHVAHLRMRLQEAAGATGAIADPWERDAASVLVVGPFGDHGDHWSRVTFAPELRFPLPGETLRGRGRTVQPRIARREPMARTISLPDPRNPLAGCWYALHRVACEQPLACFAEIECTGAFELFVNGIRAGGFDPATDPGSVARHVPVALAGGENHVVLKTCTNGSHAIALRYVDGSGAPASGIREVDAASDRAPHAAPVAAAAATWRDGFDAWMDLAPSSPWVLVATAAIALRLEREDALFRLLDAASAFDDLDPEAGLVLAGVIRGATELPEEQRLALAQSLEERALGALPATHFGALRARCTQLEEGDQREQALRLLRAHAESGKGGPGVHALWYAIVRRLRFTADEVPVLQAWCRACPRDPRPRVILAGKHLAAQDTAGAIDQLTAALLVRPDHEPAAQQLFQVALDIGDRQLAERALTARFPPHRRQGTPPEALLQARAALARRLGDAGEMQSALAELASSPVAGADTHRRIGERLLQLGDDAAAVASFVRSLELDPDQFDLRETVARLGTGAAPGADAARFRRDGLALARAYRAGPRDEGAPTTAVIDQMIVEVFPDGSQVREVHQLRRVNDLAGVEATKDARETAQADELLLIRTIATDGSTATPVRVDEGFSMTRLEPGAFVEFRYRNFIPASDAGPMQDVTFLFRSADEPYALSECVLVVPKDAPGTLRMRNLDGPAEELQLDGGRKALVFRKEDVERLPSERGTPPIQELVPVVGWGEDGTLAVTAREARWQWLRATRPSIHVERKATELLAGIEADGQKVMVMHQFCQDAIRDGQADSPTATLLRGQGNRFGLFVSLLRAAQVPFAVAFAEDEREELGGGDPSLFRDDGTFDVPAVLVATGDAAPAWFFADTPRHAPAGAVAGSRAGARALVCDADGFELVHVPVVGDAWAQSFTARGIANLGARGAVLVDLEVRFGGMAGYGIADALREQTADDQKQICRQIAQQLLPGWQLTVAEALDLDPPGKPAVLRIRASRRMLQQGEDGRALLQVPLPKGSYTPSFGDRGARTMPMRLPAELATRWELDLVLGPDLALVDVPAPVVVREGSFDHSIVFRATPTGIRIERSMTLRPTTILPQRFGDWMRALAAADRADETVIELRAKP